MTFGSFVLLVIAVGIFLAAVRAVWSSGDSYASAAAPEDVLAALRWEIPGATLEGARFEGRYKDRQVAILLRNGEYQIEIEGVPSAGDLEGAEAVASIKELMSSPDAARLSGADWQAIVQIFDAHPIRFEKGRLVATASFGGGVLGTNEEAIRLKRLLDRLIAVTQVAHVAFSLRTRAGAETRCPYCHDDFAARLQTTQCPKCGALHHVECFVEHGKCAVFACSARASNPLRDLAGPGKG